MIIACSFNLFNTTCYWRNIEWAFLVFENNAPLAIGLGMFLVVWINGDFSVNMIILLWYDEGMQMQNVLFSVLAKNVLLRFDEMRVCLTMCHRQCILLD